MTRVLVSGGTGFVGRFVVRHLLERGYDVTVGGRTPPPARTFSRPVDFAALPLDPDADPSGAFRGIYCFVHAAFEHVPGRYRGGEGDDPAGFRRANLDGTVRLFEATRDAGVRRTLFLSSRAVYGTPAEATLLTETLTPQPDTLYGRVKLDAERTLNALCGHSFVGTSLRITGVYGPAGSGRAHKWDALFDDYLAGRPIPPRAGTEVHGADVARAVSLLLESEPARVNGEVFNVSDIVVDRRDLLQPLQALSNSAAPLPLPANRAGLSPMSNAKIAALGWVPGGRGLLERTLAAMAAERLAEREQR